MTTTIELGILLIIFTALIGILVSKSFLASPPRSLFLPLVGINSILIPCCNFTSINRF
jgi:hypothetical protein